MAECIRRAWLTLGSLTMPLERGRLALLQRTQSRVPECQRDVTNRPDQSGVDDRTQFFAERLVSANITAAVIPSTPSPPASPRSWCPPCARSCTTCSSAPATPSARSPCGPRATRGPSRARRDARSNCSGWRPTPPPSTPCCAAPPPGPGPARRAEGVSTTSPLTAPTAPRVAPCRRPQCSPRRAR